MRIIKISKVNTLLVGITMIVILLCCSNQVQAALDGDYGYTVSNGNAEITRYSGAGTKNSKTKASITIPSTLGKYPVTGIDGYSFYACTGIESITFPESLTNIESYAFFGCSGLKSITFNSATTKIYDDPSTISDTAKITGYDPSTAKDYASKYNRTFEAINTTSTLQSIAITTPATKLSYTLGDSLDISGLIVTGTYCNGSTKAEPITTANVTGFNSAVAKTNEVLTLTVGAMTTTYKVQSVATIPVIEVSLNKNVTTINVGANETITATIDPTTATNQNVTWKSSNTAVATVDSNGKVVGVSAGTAVINVTTIDGSKTASCTVTVSNPIKVTSVKLNKTATNVVVGANETLSAIITATLAPTNNISIKVTWKSSNTAVATVDSSGNMVGIKAGTAVITVTTVDGSKTATCAVKVSDLVNVTGISLNKSSAELNVGANYTLIPTIAPKTATTKGVAWKSSDTTIATVDANGKIVGASVGTATITVTSLDGNMTATCTLKVSIPVTKISLSKSSSAINVGANDTLSATVIPTNATLKDVTWKSSNTAVATVNTSGNVIGIKVGTSVITATATDGSKKKASCTVTVSTPKILVTGVTLNKSSLSIKVSANETLIATLAPTNATNTKVTWKSSNTAVATVDSNGKVKGIKVGTAIITVSSQEGSKTDSCTVTVSVSEL